MARKSRIKLLHFMPETTYGVDAVAAAIAAEAAVSSIAGYEFSTPDPLAGEDLPLNYDDGNLGNKGVVLAGNHVTVSFKVYAVGAGTSATTVPPYAPLLLACLRKQVTGANVAFEIDQASVGSVTLYYYQDGTQHVVRGARGNVKIGMTAKQLPYLEFTFTGLYTPPTAALKLPTNFDAWMKPRPVGVEHTTCQFDGGALKLTAFEYDQGNKVEYVEYVGHQEVIITDMEPKAKLAFEAPALGAFNPFTGALLEAAHAFSISHQTTPLLFRWISDKLQMGRPKYGDQNGTLTYEIDVTPLGEADRIITG